MSMDWVPTAWSVRRGRNVVAHGRDAVAHGRDAVVHGRML
jgi:hypothetical protein